jgi:hypothetical protein
MFTPIPLLVNHDREAGQQYPLRCAFARAAGALLELLNATGFHCEERQEARRTALASRPTIIVGVLAGSGCEHPNRCSNRM